MHSLEEIAILSPTNKDVDYLNDIALHMMQGQAFESCGTSSIANDDSGNAAILYPTEFLNSVYNGSLPPHKLILKVEEPLYLMVHR